MGRLRTLRTTRRATSELAAASSRADWGQVIELGGRVLATDDLPTDAVRFVQLAVGRARFMRGETAAALEALEAGLEGSPPSRVDVRPYRYWAGMAAMVLGELHRARRHLLIAAETPGDGPMPFAAGAARRGLAQVDAELGNLDEALAILEAMTGAPGAAPMTWSLLARVHQRAGDGDAARRALRMGRQLADGLDETDDPAQLATAGGMLVVLAEVYVELGEADEAAACLTEAERRFAAGDVAGVPSARAVPVLRAEVARLRGDLVEADRHLAASVPTGSEDEPELRACRHRAAARVAWARGLRDVARSRYEDAAATFDAISHTYQAAAARVEAATGPPRPAQRREHTTS